MSFRLLDTYELPEWDNTEGNEDSYYTYSLKLYEKVRNILERDRGKKNHPEKQSLLQSIDEMIRLGTDEEGKYIYSIVCLSAPIIDRKKHNTFEKITNEVAQGIVINQINGNS